MFKELPHCTSGQYVRGAIIILVLFCLFFGSIALYTS